MKLLTVLNTNAASAWRRGSVEADGMVRLLLVDDHQVVRLGLASLFGAMPGMAVVGEARNASQALVNARRYRPDVVLMDVRLPDGSGIDTCRRIRTECPETRVVMLTSYPDEEAVIASLAAGAAGYLLKSTPSDRLVEAVKCVARGKSLLDPAVTTTVLDRIRRVVRQECDDPLACLSEQERKILPLIAEGKTNREIAAALCLSAHTVKAYVSSMLRKLHLNRRAEAAAFVTHYQDAAA